MEASQQLIDFRDAGTQIMNHEHTYSILPIFSFILQNAVLTFFTKFV